MKSKTRPAKYVVCVKNRGFVASLELRKVYRVVPDDAAEARRLLRVIDESGEDSLSANLLRLCRRSGGGGARDLGGDAMIHAAAAQRDIAG